MDIDFEEQVNSLDRTALSPVVRKALDDTAAEILAWTVLPLKGSSAVGYIFRLTGTARSRADVVAWSLILKIVPSPANKQVKFNFLSNEPSHFGYWKREMLLYQSGLCDELPDGLTATKNKASFPAPEAVRKLLYQATENITKKWTIPIQNWANS
jgi:hypothetical protein